MTAHRLTIPAVLLALLPAACGGSDDPPATTGARPAATATPVPLPQELVGTWTTRLRKGDLAAERLNNPFSVTISPTGGTDGGPSFLLADRQEALEGELSKPAVKGDTITLLHEGCFVEGTGYRFYDNSYRYAISGDTLTFTVVKNACKDRFAERILTSRPFTRNS